jgi:hypothetical protein
MPWRGLGFGKVTLSPMPFQPSHSKRQSSKGKTHCEEALGPQSAGTLLPGKSCSENASGINTSSSASQLLLMKQWDLLMKSHCHFRFLKGKGTFGKRCGSMNTFPINAFILTSETMEM